MKNKFAIVICGNLVLKYGLNLTFTFLLNKMDHVFACHKSIVAFIHSAVKGTEKLSQLSGFQKTACFIFLLFFLYFISFFFSRPDQTGYGFMTLIQSSGTRPTA